MNLIYFVIILLCVCFVILILLKTDKPYDHFTENDKKIAEKAVKDLHETISKGDDIPTISSDQLVEFQDRIYMVGIPSPQGEKDISSGNRENITFNQPINNRYWPYYYYSFPYQYLNTGAWPPGLYSRLYYWTPGFNTSGWSYWMRPGVYYGAWPRNRWVRNQGNYYFINNGHNTKPYRKNDFYGSQV